MVEFFNQYFDIICIIFAVLIGLIGGYCLKSYQVMKDDIENNIGGYQPTGTNKDINTSPKGSSVMQDK